MTTDTEALENRVRMLEALVHSIALQHFPRDFAAEHRAYGAARFEAGLARFPPPARALVSWVTLDGDLLTNVVWSSPASTGGDLARWVYFAKQTLYPDRVVEAVSYPDDMDEPDRIIFRRAYWMTLTDLEACPTTLDDLR